MPSSGCEKACTSCHDDIWVNFPVGSSVLNGHAQLNSVAPNPRHRHLCACVLGNAGEQSGWRLRCMLRSPPFHLQSLRRARLPCALGRSSSVEGFSLAARSPSKNNEFLLRAGL